jgi:copper(I)-binding protein
MQRRFFIGLLALAALSAGPVNAQPAKSKAIDIQRPWLRPTPPGAPNGGGYMTIVNNGAAADRLLGGSTPVAARIEVHEMSMDGSIMRMRKLDAGLALPPGKAVELKPGGLHIMVMGLKRPLKAGERVSVTLRFEKAGAVTIDMPVQAPPSAPPAHHGTHH